MRHLAFVWPTLRSTRKTPVLGAMAAGLAIVMVPAAMTVTLSPDNLAALLRLGAACAAVGLVFLFDDPAKPTTATAPAPAWRGIALRALTAAATTAAWWTAAVTITRTGAEDGTGDHLPLPGLTLEAATFTAAAVTAAVAAWRFTPRGIVSPAAAPAVLAVLAALAFVPRRVVVFVPVASPQWDAAHLRLAFLLAACVAVTTAFVTLPPALRRPAQPTVTPTDPPTDPPIGLPAGPPSSSATASGAGLTASGAGLTASRNVTDPAAPGNAVTSTTPASTGNAAGSSD